MLAPPPSRPASVVDCAFHISAGGDFADTTEPQPHAYAGWLTFRITDALTSLGGVRNAALATLNDAMGGHFVLAHCATDADALVLRAAQLDGSSTAVIVQNQYIQSDADEDHKAQQRHRSISASGNQVNGATVDASGPGGGFMVMGSAPGPLNTAGITQTWSGDFPVTNVAFGDLRAPAERLWNAEMPRLPGLQPFASLNVLESAGDAFFTSDDNLNDVVIQSYPQNDLPNNEVDFAFTSR